MSRVLSSLVRGNIEQIVFHLFEIKSFYARSLRAWMSVVIIQTVDFKPKAILFHNDDFSAILCLS